MGLSPLYEPIELLRDDGIRTFSAREIATGKVVLLYLFAGAQPQTTQELLGQIQTLLERKIPELIETGVAGGVPFVVTEYTPRVVSLREWVLTQMDRYGIPLPAGSLDHLTRVGRWKVPAAPAPIPQQHAGPGEFTRMFQAGAPPAPIGEPVPPPVAVPAPTPVAPPAPALSAQPQTGPGEFTRMFQAGAPPTPIDEPVPPVVAAPYVATPTAPQAPAYLPQPQIGPGEFTRYFSSPLPSSNPAFGLAATPQFPPPPLPILPVAPSSPATPFASPGEFTRIFGKSELSATPPAAPVLPPLPVPPAVYPAVLPTGAAAPNFLPRPQVAPQFPPPAVTSAPEVSHTPGEYTRMFGPQPGQPAPAPAPAPYPVLAPLASPLRVGGPERKKSMLPIILILAGLFLVAVLVVVTFAMRK